jgi:Arc/MetJ-type ribon-helix-helix transcriptional regulator
MEVQFSPGQKAFVREAIASGRISHEADALTQALLMWEERERRRVEILSAVELSQQSLDCGEGRRITTESELRQLGDDVKRRGTARPAAEQQRP